jgi:HAMP domain-containing protein
MTSSKSINTRRVAMALSAALAAAAIGFGTGHTSRRIANPAAGHSDVSRPSEALDHHVPAPGKTPENDRVTQLEKVKQRLIQQWRASPDPLHDFELMDNAHRQLSALSAGETRTFLRLLGVTVPA